MSRAWGRMGAGGGGPRFLIKSKDSSRVERRISPYLGGGVKAGAPLRIPGWGTGRGVGVGILRSYQVATCSSAGSMLRMQASSDGWGSWDGSLQTTRVRRLKRGQWVWGSSGTVEWKKVKSQPTVEAAEREGRSSPNQPLACERDRLRRDRHPHGRAGGCLQTDHEGAEQERSTCRARVGHDQRAQRAHGG